MKSVLFVGGAVMALLCASAQAAVVVVSPSNMNGWTFTNYDSVIGGGPEAGTTGTFVSGPSSPPQGTGSVRFTVGPNGDSAIKISTNQFNGTLLSDITKLTYSSYVTTNLGGTPTDNQQASYIQIPLDYDGDLNFDERLFFEPVYQTGTYSTVPGAGPVPDQRGGDGAAPKVGIWETYDILNGGVWTESGGFGGPPLDTIAHILADHPTAKIINSATAGGFQLVAGSGGPGDWGQFDGNVDNVTFETAAASTTFDFEPDATSAVPEPGAFLVWSVLGLAGMVAASRRNK